MQSAILVLLLSCAALASASLLVSSSAGREDAAAANRQIPGVLRFLVTPKTITSTVTVSSTTVVVKRITTSCALSVAGIPNCRRRRSVMEMEADDEEIQPSAPIRVLSTAYPEMRSLDPSNTDNNSAATEIHPSIENTSGMAEVQIHDMESICKARVANPYFGVGLAQVFGITVLFSTTVTVTQPVTTTSTTVAATNTITINGCFPSPLPFSTC